MSEISMTADVPAEESGRKWRDLLEVAATCLALGILLGYGYYFLGHRNVALEEAGEFLWLPETAIDAHIPFSPLWIWPYLVYFPFAATPIVFVRRLDWFRKVVLTYLVAYIPCLISFIIWPSKMVRAKFEVVDASTAAVEWLYNFDPGMNVFPSLHVTNAILVAWIFQRLWPRVAPVMWIIAGAISISTVMVKQHYFVDVPAGILLGTFSFFVVFGWKPKAEAESGPEAESTPDSAGA